MRIMPIARRFTPAKIMGITAKVTLAGIALGVLATSGVGARPADSLRGDSDHRPSVSSQDFGLVDTVTNDISVPQPVVTWDNTRHAHKITAKFVWPDNHWNRDLHKATGYGPIGGEDAFGIRFTHGVVNLGGHLQLCGAKYGSGVQKPGCWKTSAFKTNNNYGGMIAFQDRGKRNRLWGGAHNAASGTLEMWVKFPSSQQKCYQVFAHYAHTWSKGEINSITVGPADIGVGWSNAKYGWGRVSASPVRVGKRC